MGKTARALAFGAIIYLSVLIRFIVELPELPMRLSLPPQEKRRIPKTIAPGH